MSMRAFPAAVCLLTLAVLGSSPPAAASAELKTGQAFPEITLPSLEGPELSIADFRGRKIALHIFASW